MTDDKWSDVLAKIREDFSVEEEFDGEVENIPGATFSGIVFFTPAAKMKVTRTKRPRVIDKKTSYSNRVGGQVHVDYVYSETEFVDDLEIHQWSDAANDWIRATADFFNK
jgi:hypothetical protein